MKLKISQSGAALHPSEVIVEVKTEDGIERLVVDAASIENNTIEVGFPVGRKNLAYLVELPRETFRGTWRVWVDEDQLVGQLEKVA